MGRQSRGCAARRRCDIDLDLDDPGGSGSLLKYLTRLLFVTILLSCVVVLAVSLLLLMQCRRQVKPMEGLVEASRGQCSNLGIPAYFSCVVIVVTVFGFGCVGRKVSGLLLVAVSTVAMVIAVVLLLTRECTYDVRVVRESLLLKLQECGLHPASAKNYFNNSSKGDGLYPAQFQRFEFLLDSSSSAACQETASNLNSLCHYNASTENRQLLNHTGVQQCAGDVSSTLQKLCLQDNEVAFPLLLTLPIFYIGIGLGLIYIKQADNRRWTKAERPSSVGTSTRRVKGSRQGSQRGSGRHVLSRCLTSLCARHPLCFTCLLHGHRCSCCRNTPTRPTSSPLSFHLNHVVEGEDGDGVGAAASQHMLLRTHSPPEAGEELHLMDECV